MFPKSEIPIIVGFVLRDGSCISSSGTGHRAKADEFIRKHGLQQTYNNYKKERFGESDDFMIESLGAMKIFMQGGEKKLCIPIRKNDVLKKYIKMYLKEGYIVDNDWAFKNSPKWWEEEERYPYNQTVVVDVDSNGKIFYRYNPLRNGD